MIHYALGMGLVSAMKSKGVWQLGLTPLGDCVVREDPLLGEPLSLWLLHLLLCRRCGHDVPAVGLADPWFALFAEGPVSLGSQFTEAAFHRLLVQRHGNKSYLKGLSTLVPRMYTERACFGEAGILTAAPGDDGKPLLRRARAPLEKGLFPAYSLLLFLLWDAGYSADKQLAFDELARDRRLLALLGWDVTQATEWLDWMASRGLVQLDRYTGSVVLLRLAETPKVVAGLYSELV